uniref:beta-ketoacyl synthase N-terminal-like domain-containing protein n=1 Tax=Paenibacillus hexagrammi TaxID=2908839 RepID=UPI0021A2B354|nr:beta-ketoacyl synthase N-terminal-like domain-containing protein [Paenibacillus sp. YPD9-1]
MAPKSHTHKRFTSLKRSPEERENEVFDVAIIGVSGRYPGARNLQEFWNNLRNGRDCITEIPKERWDSSVYFDEDKTKSGKTYSKWGDFWRGSINSTRFSLISPPRSGTDGSSGTIVFGVRV